MRKFPFSIFFQNYQKAILQLIGEHVRMYFSVMQYMPDVQSAGKVKGPLSFDPDVTMRALLYRPLARDSDFLATRMYQTHLTENVYILPQDEVDELRARLERQGWDLDDSDDSDELVFVTFCLLLV